MKTKAALFLLLVSVSASLLSACTQKSSPDFMGNTKSDLSPSPSSASITDTPAASQSDDALLNSLNSEDDSVLDQQFSALEQELGN